MDRTYLGQQFLLQATTAILGLPPGRDVVSVLLFSTLALFVIFADLSPSQHTERTAFVDGMVWIGKPRGKLFLGHDIQA